MAHLAGFGRPNTAVGCLVVTLAPVCQRPASDEKSRSFAVVGFLAGGGFGRPSWATTAHGPALRPRRVGLASLATPHAPLGAPGTRPSTCPIGTGETGPFWGPPFGARHRLRGQGGTHAGWWCGTMRGEGVSGWVWATRRVGGGWGTWWCGPVGGRHGGKMAARWRQDSGTPASCRPLAGWPARAPCTSSCSGT